MRTYTFHVTIPGHGRVWRKLELAADATLEGLHYAIQDAYAFDADHLYSFFMSGKAWDNSTEYTLPEDALWEDDEAGEEESAAEAERDEKADEVLIEATGLPPAQPEPIGMPSADQLREMIQILKSDPQARQQFAQAMSEQMGLPPAMANMIISNMEDALKGMSDDQVDELLDMSNLLGEEEDREPAGDVRTTTLAALQLRKGQQFLYLFDYGDEWQFNVRVHTIRDNADENAEYPRLVESVGDAPEQYPDWEEDEEWDEDDEWEESQPDKK
ncbi:MAG: hypothetical protein KF832_09750 [Caldilineaceae bacterium]|nr:hypothetical protein [Caldilineaceae bacterium]